MIGSRATYLEALTGPTGATGPSGLIQTTHADVAAASTVAGGAFTTLVTVPIVTLAGSTLLVQFSASAQANGGAANLIQTFYRLRLDGVVMKGAGTTAPPSSGGGGTGGNREETAAIMARFTGLAAGAHVVDVEWATVNSGGGPTASINTALNPNSQHGTLVVEEVTV